MSSKTEKEKMLSGEFYDPSDKTLLEDRKRAKELCHEFNTFSPKKTRERQEILQKLFDSEFCGHIESPFFCDYGYNIDLGRDFYANHNCIILDANEVKIGDRVKLGPSVEIYTPKHPFDNEKRRKGLEKALSVKIGDNVWIGGGTIINPGTKIGNNSIVGSGSVVTKDIPPNTRVVGNPARPIKKQK